MPNVAKVLKEEITRLARREVKAGLASLRREQAAMKKKITDLRKLLADSNRTSAPQRKKKAEAPADGAPGKQEATRVFAKSVKSMRSKLGLSQAEFGKLIGVSAQTVYQWERKEGVLTLRRKQREAFAKVRGIGKREAARRLAEG